MKRLLVILTLLTTISCSESKKISKFVEKHGPEKVATHIAEKYPRLFKVDTLLVRDSFPYPVEVRIPEVRRDTIFSSDTVTLCDFFRYSDNRLSFVLKNEKGKKKVSYTIKERIIKDTIAIIREIKVPGPPCPTIEIIQAQKDKHIKEIIALESKLSVYKKLFYGSLLIILLIIAFLLLRNYAKRYLQI